MTSARPRPTSRCSSPGGGDGRASGQGHPLHVCGVLTSTKTSTETRGGKDWQITVSRCAVCGLVVDYSAVLVDPPKGAA